MSVPVALDFSGRGVLVAGGSSGIGNAIARAFLDAGAKVDVWGTRPTAADYDGEEGSDLRGLGYTSCDVTDPAEVAAGVAAIGGLGVVVLCQGLAVYGRAEFERETFLRVLDVNLTSLMTCATAVRPRLAASQGALIVVSSSAAYHATRGNPAYNASKTGAVGLTRTLGQAWAPDGIRVNGIAPGYVATRMTAVTTDNPRRREAAIAKIPLGRFGTPAEMAGVAMFLASPLSGFVVGQTLLADGGMLL